MNKFDNKEMEVIRYYEEYEHSGRAGDIKSEIADMKKKGNYSSARWVKRGWQYIPRDGEGS